MVAVAGEELHFAVLVEEALVLRSRIARGGGGHGGVGAAAAAAAAASVGCHSLDWRNCRTVALRVRHGAGTAVVIYILEYRVMHILEDAPLFLWNQSCPS